MDLLPLLKLINSKHVVKDRERKRERDIASTLDTILPKIFYELREK